MSEYISFFCTAKPGRVVGPVLPYENGRSSRESCDPRIYRNAILPPQVVSPHCFFRTHTANLEKSVVDTQRDSSQAKPQPESQPFRMAAKPAPAMAVDVNPNPYYQPQTKVEQLNAIDAKLLQAQSRFGAVGAAAVAVAAHRNTGAVQYGLS